MPIWTELKKLSHILQPEDYRQFGWLFLAMLGAALLQVTGVASILPFMQLLSRPDAIEEVAWLSWAYGFFGFESQRQMLLWTGVLVGLGYAFGAQIERAVTTGWGFMSVALLLMMIVGTAYGWRRVNRLAATALRRRRRPDLSRFVGIEELSRVPTEARNA